MTVLDETHDPALSSWVESANGHPDFPIQNLPIGLFVPAAGGEPRPGIAIGEMVLELAALGHDDNSLDALLAGGAAVRASLRRRASALLASNSNARPFLHTAERCALLLPATIGDYTDFYAGIHHARNVGALFRPDDPLLPNYKHVPIGYHGRASSIVSSGAPVHRPSGQTRPPDAAAPQFGRSLRLDYELELGIWIGPGNALGTPIPIDAAGDHIAGYCLLNDWSARDIQAWEYQPLGPFLAKNFMTSVSPWIISPEALAPFRIAQPPRPEGDPEPLAYLREADGGCYAIDLEVLIHTARMRASGAAPFRLSRGPMQSLYWTPEQLVAHHASNGCNLRPGDLLGTGTISADDPGGYGSLLEISQGGKNPIALPGGEARTFLETGDEIAFCAQATAPGYVPIGFGTCRGRVVD